MISQFKSALRNYFKSKKRSCVIFGRNFKSQHLQLQVFKRLYHHIPLHRNYITYLCILLPDTDSDALRQAFLDHGQSVSIQLHEVPRDTPITEVIAMVTIACCMSVNFMTIVCSTDPSWSALLHD